MTTPSILPYVSGQWNLFEYKLHDDTDANYAIYDLYLNNNHNNNGQAIRVGKTPGHTDHDVWSDAPGSIGTNNPAIVVVNGIYIDLMGTNNTLFYRFVKPTLNTTPPASWLSSGPNVTSIGASVIFVPNDTVSNTDFTLLKNGVAYSNTNITLTGPGPQLPSDARGYSYSLTYDGTAWYKRTIDSKSYEDFYYDDSWTSDVSGAASNRQTSANRILNVLGKIPSTTTMSISSTSTWTFDKREDHYVRYSGPTNAGQATPEITFVVSGNSTNIVGWFNYYDETDYINSPTFNIGEQQTMSWTPSFLTNTTFSVEDWVYSNEPEGNGYVPPQQPIRRGNGYPDRYPLIMTNLFARQRSIYSIGMTHKDTWDLFL